MNIKVESPCPFLLNRMGKEGKDYFCKSCSKTVVDFREKTEDEIKCFANTGSCGVFTINQLKGQQRLSVSRQTIFYALTVISFFGFNVKPITAQNVDTVQTQTEAHTLEESSQQVRNFEKEEVTKKEKNIRSKKSLFRRKKKEKVIIGCPSF